MNTPHITLIDVQANHTTRHLLIENFVLYAKTLRLTETFSQIKTLEKSYSDQPRFFVIRFLKSFELKKNLKAHLTSFYSIQRQFDIQKYMVS